MPGQPPLNHTTTTTFTVSSADLASAFSTTPDDTFAPVLATSRLVVWMEIPCARQLVPYLPPNHLSVGVRVDITHSAPTPPGLEVTVQAKFTGMQGSGGKLYGFEVVAWDRAGEVGRCTHTRAVVDLARLESGARRRIGDGTKSRNSGAL